MATAFKMYEAGDTLVREPECVILTVGGELGATVKSTSLETDKPPESVTVTVAV